MYDCFDVADCRPPPPPPSSPEAAATVDLQRDAERAHHVARFESQGGRAFRRGTAPVHRRGGGGAVGEGDPAIVGVARPADYNDQNLTKWIKDPTNPIIVGGKHGAYAGQRTHACVNSKMRVDTRFNAAIP